MRPQNPRTKGAIPLCRSDLLQDVTIALGPRLKAVRYRHRKKLTFTVSEDPKCDDIERLEIEADEFPGIRKKIALWADGTAWFWHATQQAPVFECHASLAGMSPCGIADLIRASLMDFAAAREQWLQHPVKSAS